MKYRKLLAFPLFALTLMPLAAGAAPSTGTGQISVAQVNDLLSRAPQDRAVRNALVAYLAGVGETAGLLVGEAGRLGVTSYACQNPLSIGDDVVRAALVAAAPDKTSWMRTPATPIIVADMLHRAGCK